MSKIVTVKLSELKRRLFVSKSLDEGRVVGKSLDEDRLEYLQQLSDAGEKFPPIKITKDYVLVDGWLRVELAERIGQTTIEAEIVSLI